MAASGSGAGGVAFIFVLLLAGLYFIPTIVAFIRKVPNAGAVLVINLFLGWTLIGWVVAMAMAARSVPPPPIQQHYYNQPPPPPPPSP